MSLLWLLIWQDFNQNDNTNNESALTRWFKIITTAELERKTHDQHDNDDNDKASNNKASVGLQKGADGRKFQLGCAIPSGMHHL